MCMVRNPYCCDVYDIPVDIQDEFLDLQNDSSAKDIFKDSKLEDFSVQMNRVYSKTSEYALKMLLPFSSTYLCESEFSALLCIKNKTRNKLSVEDDLRCALSNTVPSIDGLVKKKQCQKSH